MSSSSSAAASLTGPKTCFNTQCNESITQLSRRKGWKLRSGELAELCERCCSAFDKGNFCETFHLDAAGWRKCESCGKMIHCGCIVSVSAYMFLDVGGVECMVCVRKAYSAVPNQVCSPPKALSSRVSSKALPLKSWNQMAGSFPGQWRHPANIWNSSSIQSDLHQRLSYEFDKPNVDRLIAGARSYISAQEKMAEGPERTVSSSGLNHIARDIYGENDSMSIRKGMASDPCCSGSSGVNIKTHQNLHGKPSTTLNGDSTTLLAAPFSSVTGTNNPARVLTTQPQQQAAPSSLTKQFYSSTPNSADSIGDSQAHTCNGKGRADPRVLSHLLPRYWPRITNQELQISGDSNSGITPLFEKVLSASDAGRIGRLVLPKKCAEAYFPLISQPEGLPLKMQDASGKEWVFQFRFWPNNNSRMYVLEGVTPCIQSMQLQAGDTVTFSRIIPEGKFVMGFRKAANASIDEQGIQAAKDENGCSAPSDVKANGINFIENVYLRPHKGSTESRSQANTANTANKAGWSNNEKSGFMQKVGCAPKASNAFCKRKGNTLGSKSKRLQIENGESIELKLSWGEAQFLLRSATNDGASIVSVEGHDIEEYEEAPLLGMPTYFTKNPDGDINNQWAQCEDCSKWRRLPLNALLHHRWTCSDNTWDPERSSCSAPQETSAEITHLLPGKAGSSKRSKVKFENEKVEVSDGLDTLANLAILGEDEPLSFSSQPTTKHPRHRVGCSCIVCIQPPSGKGPKHKQTCTCNVCLTVKRRFQTLMLRREKRQSEKESENSVTCKVQDHSNQSPEMPESPQTSILHPAGASNSLQMAEENNDSVIEVESERKQTALSPIKTQIDLNIQPEREEEPSPVGNAVSSMRAFEGTVV